MPDHWSWDEGEFPLPHIMSASDWKSIIDSPEITIVDEYGREESPSDFWSFVDGKRGAKTHKGLGMDTFSDKEGYEFSPTEFS